jgi:hypothetical protein
MKGLFTYLFLFISITIVGQVRIVMPAPVIAETGPSGGEEDIWYQFENNEDDASGNGYDFTNTSWSYTTGTSPPQGSYWVADASTTGAYGTLPSSYTNSFPPDFSIAFYFRTASSQNWWVIESGTKQVSGFSIRVNVPGDDFDVFTNNVEVNANNFGTALNTTNHFVICYESTTGYVDIYVNGVLETSNGDGDAGIPLTNAWYMMNGAVGNFDDFRVFPKILNQTEVTRLYNNPDDPL